MTAKLAAMGYGNFNPIQYLRLQLKNRWVVKLMPLIT